MKTSLLFTLFLSVLMAFASCEKPKEEQTSKDISITELVEGNRYDLKMLKNNQGQLFGIYTDRFDGSVYIWKGGSSAFKVATAELELPSYNVPTYSSNVFLNDKNNPDVYLFDANTSGLYLFSSGNSGSFKEVKVSLK